MSGQTVKTSLNALEKIVREMEREELEDEEAMYSPVKATDGTTRSIQDSVGLDLEKRLAAVAEENPQGKHGH